MSSPADVNGKDVQPAYALPLALAAEGLSFLACILMLIWLLRLGETSRRRLFPRQLLQLALAGIVFGLGSTLQDLIEFGGWFQDGGGDGMLEPTIMCRYWKGVPYRVGRAVTVLTEVHIAASFALATAQADKTYPWLFASLSWLWLLGLVYASVELMYLNDKLTYNKETMKCELESLNIPAALLLMSAFLAMILAYVATLVHSRRQGARVVRAALRSFVYPLVFCVSFALILADYIVRFNSGPLYLAAQCLQHCNGFFNLVAYLWCSHKAWSRSEGRLLASPFAPWTEAFRSARAGPGASPAPNGRGSYAGSDRRLLVHACYLEGAADPPSSINGDDSSIEGGTPVQPAGTEAQEPLSPTVSASTATTRPSSLDAREAQERLAGRPPLSAFVWRRPADSCWPRAELEPALFEQAFSALRLLGSGSFGSVMLATARADFGDVRQGENYAVKVIRATFANQLARYAYQERDVLRSVQHPGVVKLHEALQLQEVLLQPPTLQTWVLVMEYCPGGDLLRKMSRKGNPGLEVAASVRHAAEMLEALCYLHGRRVMHRDLKPGNILLSATDRCKIGDFGLATAGSRARTRAGSQGYTAPEILLRQAYGKAADIFSWGRVFEFMLTADLHIDVGFSLTAAGMPEEVVSIITKATGIKPEKRGTAEDLRNHPCFADIDWDTLFSD